METTATVMTARQLAQQIKFRGCLAHAVRYRARNKVKEQLRAAGLKISGFSAKDLSELAEKDLANPEYRQRLVDEVRPWVEELVFKSKR